MIIGDKNEKLNIHIGNSAIEQVDNYKYLGVLIDKNRKKDSEIDMRINKTAKLYYTMKDKFINNRNVSERTKIRVFCSIYRPILTFGCETWVLDNRQKSKIQASEMMYLRRIKGITRLDKICGRHLAVVVGWRRINERIAVCLSKGGDAYKDH